MLNPEENELLCRVEGDAPMGRLMRNHWLPACMSEEVAEPDGDPISVRLLGEDLVVFRDSAGQLGALGARCPHRLASLSYGRNEQGGLRCLYHGWKFDVHGNIVEMPSEGRRDIHLSYTHKSYPLHEFGGMVWVYLGADKTAPLFEAPPYAQGRNAKISIAKIQVQCNWAQVLEGGIDSSHSSSLHSTEIQASNDVQRATMASERLVMRPSTDKAPRLQVERTSYGLRYVALRTPIHDADKLEYARVTVFVAPFTLLIPPNSAYRSIQFIVPIDDTHTMFYFVAWSDELTGGQGIDQDAWRTRVGARPGIDVDAFYRSMRTVQNHHLQDRAQMRDGSFTGIEGIAQQDMAMWETMGPIVDRSVERLGSSDVAIVQFRRLMVEAAKGIAQGRVPTFETSGQSPSDVRSFEGLVSKPANWSEIDLRAQELATGT